MPNVIDFVTGPRLQVSEKNPAQWSDTEGDLYESIVWATSLRQNPRQTRATGCLLNAAPIFGHYRALTYRA